MSWGAEYNTTAVVTMNAVKVERQRLRGLSEYSFTYSMALYLTKDIDDTADNVLLVIGTLVLLIYLIMWLSCHLVVVYERMTAQLELERTAATKLSDLGPSATRLMILPVKCTQFMLRIGLLLLVQKTTVLMAKVMMTLLPNSSSDEIEGDSMMQTFPPVIFVGGILFLCAYSVDGLDDNDTPT